MARILVSILLVVVDQAAQHLPPEASPRGNDLIPYSD